MYFVISFVRYVFRSWFMYFCLVLFISLVRHWFIIHFVISFFIYVCRSLVASGYLIYVLLSFFISLFIPVVIYFSRSVFRSVFLSLCI